MTKLIEVSVPMDKLFGGRLRNGSVPREIQFETEEIKQGNFLIRLRFDAGAIMRNVLDDDFASGNYTAMGMTD